MPIYNDIRKLGSGGFGEVWLCKRQNDKAIFAKKKLLADDQDSITRLVREVRILNRLNHPNIIKVVGLHLKESPYWYVMPRYDHTLLDALPALVGDDERIAKIFGSILDAMEYAHGEGVIH
jgi:serine/threonine-protein kinase